MADCGPAVGVGEGGTAGLLNMDHLLGVPGGGLEVLSDDQLVRIRALVEGELAKRQERNRDIPSLTMAAAGDGRPLLDALNLASLHGIVARCLVATRLAGGDVPGPTLQAHLAQRWLLLRRCQADNHPETVAAWDALVMVGGCGRAVY